MKPVRDNLTIDDRRLGGTRSAEVRRTAAREALADVLPTMRELRADDLSFGAIAKRLNAAGRPAPRGGRWSGAQVRRALATP